MLWYMRSLRDFLGTGGNQTDFVLVVTVWLINLLNTFTSAQLANSTLIFLQGSASPVIENSGMPTQCSRQLKTSAGASRSCFRAARSVCFLSAIASSRVNQGVIVPSLMRASMTSGGN